MSKTKAINFSDAAIRRHLKEERVMQLRDLRYPLRLRINKARDGGSWYVVRYSDSTSKWRKIGNSPALPAKTLNERMPDMTGEFTVDRSALPAAHASFRTVGDLIRWHLSRTTADKNMSQSRRASLLSSTKKHIIPRMGPVPLSDVTHQVV